jgi:hypothetical protein
MARNPGLACLSEGLRAFFKTMKQAVQPAIQRSGNELSDRMRQLAPVDEGS